MTDPARTPPVTAVVLFDGLLLMCINKNKRDRCEVGFIKCPLHSPTLVIDPDPSGDPPLIITEDLYIQVVNPVAEGVTRRSAGDETDFDLVLDLEGFSLHRDKVAVDTRLFVSKLAINAGELYAFELRTEKFKVLKWSPANPAGAILGRFQPIQDWIGLNITCRDVAGSGIAIVNAAGTKVRWLPAESGPYSLTVRNDCTPPTPLPVGTDFRLYYTVVTPKDDQRYDFTKIGTGPAPDVCEGAFLSKTDSLDFPFEP